MTRELPVQLLGDIIMVKAQSLEVLPSGLIAPAQFQHMDLAELHYYHRMGTVLLTGPGARDKKTGKRKPMELKAGDTVLFTRWHGQQPQGEINCAWDDDTLFMHESEVLLYDPAEPTTVDEFMRAFGESAAAKMAGIPHELAGEMFAAEQAA